MGVVLGLEMGLGFMCWKPSSAVGQVSHGGHSLPSFLQGATRCWSAWSAGPCSTASTSRALCTASPSRLTAGKGLLAQGWSWLVQTWGAFSTQDVPVGACAVPCVGSPDSLEPGDPAWSRLLRVCPCGPSAPPAPGWWAHASRPWGCEGASSFKVTVRRPCGDRFKARGKGGWFPGCSRLGWSGCAVEGVALVPL